jgi:hypothetical protein
MHRFLSDKLFCVSAKKPFSIILACFAKSHGTLSHDTCLSFLFNSNLVVVGFFMLRSDLNTDIYGALKILIFEFCNSS